MMRITDAEQLAPLLAPLEKNAEGHAVGEPVEESSSFLKLEAEMMKIGSLQHGEVDWVAAETLAIDMLSQQGKDAKVLSHLLHCFQQEGNARRFTLSLQLLSQCLTAWWDVAYPFTGPRGAKMRPRLFQQIAQRTAKLASSVRIGDEETYQHCINALTVLRATVTEKALPDQALDELQRQIESLQPAKGTSATNTSPSAGDTPSISAEEQASNETSAPTAKLPEVRMESGNERANRQAILKMADFLAEQSPGEPLVYRLRRYAVWGVIQALPMSRNGGRTELAPVSGDRVAEYRDSLSRGGDLALWQRIENSLAVSPYWLEGHRLSAELAQHLGHSRCADAICEETRRFVSRLPGIEKLTFNDGTPFVEEETQRWLHQPATPAAAPAGQGDVWQESYQAALEALDSEGLATALKQLDQGLASASSPREAVYWRLASADLLLKAGLKSLAHQHYQTLYDTVTTLALEQWEPGLVSRLQSSLTV
nr:type VI secretion system protein TssA [Halomonas colorata]